MVKGVSRLLRSKHVDQEEAIARLKLSLRRLSQSGSYVVVEVERLTCGHSGTSWIEIDGVRFPRRRD